MGPRSGGGSSESHRCGPANAYVNDGGTEVAIVQVHPDADLMEFHMQVVREHIERAYREFLDATTSLQVFGKLSDAALER